MNLFNYAAVVCRTVCLEIASVNFHMAVREMN